MSSTRPSWWSLTRSHEAFRSAVELVPLRQSVQLLLVLVRARFARGTVLAHLGQHEPAMNEMNEVSRVNAASRLARAFEQRH